MSVDWNCCPVHQPWWLWRPVWLENYSLNSTKSDICWNSTSERRKIQNLKTPESVPCWCLLDDGVYLASFGFRCLHWRPFSVEAHTCSLPEENASIHHKSAKEHRFWFRKRNKRQGFTETWNPIKSLLFQKKSEDHPVVPQLRQEL